MPKEMKFEGGKIVETRMDIVLIRKQDVEFSDPPPKTEKEMIKFIHKQGFHMGFYNPEHRVLLVEEGLAIGVFRSLEEIYHYVKNEYPATDIEKHKSELLANGYPEDFHKLPRAVQEQWDELPEDVKQIIREKGAGILEMRKLEDGEDGVKIFHPNPNFQAKPDKRETEGDEELIEYIKDSGFQIHAFEDGGVGVEINAKYVIGPFASLANAYRYLKEGHHLDDIEIIRQMDDPTVH